VTERIVEVPFVREKIVTRTVYVTRRAGTRAARAERGELARSAGHASGSGVKASSSDTLVGFRPAEDVKVRVIKGNYSHGK
jgi:hypothetical protein